MKYYAVKRGRNPGIYTSWDSCLKEVKGFSNASYKSFKKKEDAIAFMEDRQEEIKVDEHTICGWFLQPKRKDLWGRSSLYH